MHELTLWKKQEIDKLRKDMDSLFRRFRKEFGLPSSLSEVAEPFSMDLSETESTLTVSAELPGIKPEDIHISVTENTLTLWKTPLKKAGTTRELREARALFRAP